MDRKQKTVNRLRAKLGEREANKPVFIEPEHGSDSESSNDESDEYEVSSEDEFWEEYTNTGLTQEEKYSLKKFNLRKEYNVDIITPWFVRETSRKDSKHNNLVRFSILSGVTNAAQRKKLFSKICNEILLFERTKQGLDENSGIVGRLAETEILGDVWCCYHAAQILNIIGCNDFLETLSGKILSSDFGHTLLNYLQTNEEQIRMILVKSKYDDIDALAWSSELTNKAFAIEIKKRRNIIYMKSCWEWDKINNRILPINPNGMGAKTFPTMKKR